MRDHVSGDAIKQQTAGAPLGAGLVAFGIGFLVAAAFRLAAGAGPAERAHDALDPSGRPAEAGQRIAVLKDDAPRPPATSRTPPPPPAGDVTDTAKEQAAATKDDASTISS